MPSKKYYNGRRKEKNGGDSEIFGIVLVIISAFILLCIVIRPILGVISKSIFNVTIGIFGLFAYPLFLSTLLWGIALIQGRSAALSLRYKIGLVCAIVSLMLILQLATTHSLVKESFSAYISGTYHGITAGGLLFGVIAYAIQAVVTPVVSYVLYSLLFVCSLLFFFAWPFYTKRRRANGMPKQPEQQLNPFVKGLSSPQQIRPLTDNTLFVDTIRPTQPENTLLQNMPVSPQNAPITEQQQPIRQESKEVQFQPYTDKHTTHGGFKSEAHKILFGDQQKLISDMAAQSSKPSAVSYGQLQADYMSQYTLPPLSLSPNIIDRTPPVQQPQNSAPAQAPQPMAEKPQKRVHISDIPGLNEIPLLPEKDISQQIVGSAGIINGDDLSRQLAETMAPVSKEQPKTQPQADVFTPKKATTSSVFSKEPEEEIHPIVNGDYFGSPKKQAPTVVHPISQPSYTDSQISSSAQTTFVQSQAKAPVEPEEEPLAPIVSASRYESQQNAELRFQQLLNEERQRSVAAETTPQEPETEEEESTDDSFAADTTPSFSDMFTQEEAPAFFADTLPEQPRESSFNIIEDPIDLSEQSHFEGNDSTGYYETVSLADIKPVSKKSVHSGNQLQIDDIVPEPIAAPKPKKRKKLRYNAPDIDMLISSESTAPEHYNVACEEKARLLEETLQGLKLPVKVGAITRGPAVTRYELEMPPGIPIKRIEQFSTDIEYYLESNGKIRIEAPIPGKRAVGIEVPNEKIDIVCLRDIIESKEFQNSSSPLTLSLGKDIAGTNIVCNLEKMPHLLIAGATGSGKSACLNSIIISIMYKSSPEDVRLILIDPKRVEFNMYQGIPHLLGSEIINDAQQAINALTWAKEEMDRRYILFGNHKVRNLPEFNKSEAVKAGEEQKLPYIVLIVDELAELMLDNNKKVLETKIMSMAQKARAAGIHLILATQRPSVDVITGTIKANLPSRIAFSVKSIVDSRTILDQCGAETLLGRGDMLYAPIGLDDPKRVQGAFVTEQEITAVTEYVRANNEVDFDDEFTAAITKRNEEPESNDEEEDDSKEFDSLMPEVLKCVIESGSASTSMIQRRFSVGYARASRIIDQMELHKFIGPLEGSKPRAVYISREQYKEIFGIDL